MNRPQSLNIRIAIGGLGLLVLITMYVGQRVDVFSWGMNTFRIDSAGTFRYLPFIVNKTLRLVVNDLACLLLILAFFQRKEYVQISFYVFLFELLLLLPGYFYLKLLWEGDSEISSPLFSQWHRLIVNPMLMILLMIGFLYQKYRVN